MAIDYNGFILEPGIIETTQESKYFYLISGTVVITPAAGTRRQSRVLAELFIEGHIERGSRLFRRPVRIDGEMRKVEPDLFSELTGWMAGVVIGTWRPRQHRLLGQAKDKEGAKAMISAFMSGYTWKGGCRCSI